MTFTEQISVPYFYFWANKKSREPNLCSNYYALGVKTII